MVRPRWPSVGESVTAVLTARPPLQPTPGLPVLAEETGAVGLCRNRVNLTSTACAFAVVDQASPRPTALRGRSLRLPRCVLPGPFLRSRRAGTGS